MICFVLVLKLEFVSFNGFVWSTFRAAKNQQKAYEQLLISFDLFLTFFHRLRPYLCSKRDVLGFGFGYEPFLLLGPLFMTGDGPKLVHFGPKMAEHGRLVNVPKWFKRVQLVNLTVFDRLHPFRPIWTHLGHFKQKLIFCSKAPLPNPTLSFWGEKIIFV